MTNEMTVATPFDDDSWTVCLPPAEVARCGLSSDVVALTIGVGAVYLTYEVDGKEREWAEEPGSPDDGARIVALASADPAAYALGMLADAVSWRAER